MACGGFDATINHDLAPRKGANHARGHPNKANPPERNEQTRAKYKNPFPQPNTLATTHRMAPVKKHSSILDVSRFQSLGLHTIVDPI